MRPRNLLAAAAVALLLGALTACGGSGSSATAPNITAFGASPSSISSGGSSTLSWTVTGTSPVTLSIDQGVGDVSGSSSVSVSPATTTTYTLTATNSAGNDTASTTVTVSAPAGPAVWGTSLWGSGTWGP